MKKIKLFVCFLLCLMLLLTPNVAFADVYEQNTDQSIVTEFNSDDLTDPVKFDANETVASIGTAIDVRAKSCILMEVSTGRILYESESHLALPPASITKVMALLLIMEAIDSGQLALETELTASAHACSMGGSQIWLEPNERMTVNDLLKATVIGSANDATVVLGEALAGSEEGFVAMMNERADQLGLKDTVFKNCTGLDADGHLTSAHDIAVMSRELIKHDLIKQYSTVWMDSLRDGQSELVNTNKLVRFYEGCTGLKTGTTSKAGACLSATAERDGLELVAVVMGAANSNDRFNGARKLLDYGFANYCVQEVAVDSEALKEIPVADGIKKTLKPEASQKEKFLIEKSKAKTLTVETELSDSLKAPVLYGQQVGVARIFVGGVEIGTVKITASDSIPKLSFKYSLKNLIKNIFYV